jgi:hypothetical protein
LAKVSYFINMYEIPKNTLNRGYKDIQSLYNEALRFKNSEIGKPNPDYNKSIFDKFEAITKEMVSKKIPVTIQDKRLNAASLYQMG